MSELVSSLEGASDCTDSAESGSEVLPDLLEWKDLISGDFISLTYEVIDVLKLTNLVRSDRAGAVSTFLGTTRDHFEGLQVVSLEYEAYGDMALVVMKEIVEKIRSRWQVQSVVIQHKLGPCPVGEVSVFIAVSSEHRAASLEAVAFAIDDLKANVPIWKKELYAEGGSQWKKNKEFVVESI